MTVHHPELAERVRRQGVLQPAMYGEVDLSATPYRFTTDPEVKASLPDWVAPRAPLLADEATVELMRTATLLGDVAADPYAALMDTYGVKRLIAMLTTACREDIDAVEDPPQELRDFVAAMEVVPDWLDRELVEEGARHSRIAAALLAPFLTRGAFLATFINTYAALPMALTGALSDKRAARRVVETTSFFAVTTLPHALDRHGIGFETTAHVRLMHAVVRRNALRSPRWDPEVYGVPVPQVDQMPAGMINVYILAMAAIRAGRTAWTPRERAIHEFVRYRCYLMGLPEDLLPCDPAGIVRVFHTRAATLRDDFDEATCGALVRSTLAAYLRPRRTPHDRVADRVEKAWSKVFFARAFGRGRGLAAGSSVRIDRVDRALVALTTPYVLGRFTAVVKASEVPALRPLADAYALRVLRRCLARYGVDEAMTESHGRMAA
ncbi:oxygenase MpaB family protein [Nocardioides maradonensis]